MNAGVVGEYKNVLSFLAECLSVSCRLILCPFSLSIYTLILTCNSPDCVAV
jgi:hypothetical protein